MIQIVKSIHIATNEKVKIIDMELNMMKGLLKVQITKLLALRLDLKLYDKIVKLT